MRRHRNALLDAALQFSALHRGAGLRELIVFLYVCENEGLNIQELSTLSKLPQASASRAARALGTAGSDWATRSTLGLVDVFLHPADGRSHVLRLTDQGRALRDRFDEIIRRATPINLDEDVWSKWRVEE